MRLRHYELKQEKFFNSSSAHSELQSILENTGKSPNLYEAGSFSNQENTKLQSVLKESMKNATIAKKLEEWVRKKKITEYKTSTVEMYLSGINEIICLVACVICNVLLICGIGKDRPHLMIPWLVVYLIGTISLYIGSIMILLSNQFIKALLPFCIGILFTILWFKVKVMFLEMKKESYRRQRVSYTEMITAV
ncbi:uncharacterized protein LOC111697362 [Eurytemora carolleeae]|uniref:uncharacterized protein LOC111697362 n=1 Tax=Eurytemora carolleeae TaxID=1294199 RepID=UPI000C759D9D|nr:uncharacterized protein LOC111697362 [Eurytemora carolleeae]|eukprot:XP_023323112.1 uncharacterized protein LOC111697362 [Eurytemora affinis]